MLMGRMTINGVRSKRLHRKQLGRKLFMARRYLSALERQHFVLGHRVKYRVVSLHEIPLGAKPGDCAP